jgi:hypothetical protein
MIALRGDSFGRQSKVKARPNQRFLFETAIEFEEFLAKSHDPTPA